MSPFVRLPVFFDFWKIVRVYGCNVRAVTALDAVPTALAIFSWGAPADPVKIHDMFFAALRAQAFHFGFVVIDHHIGFFDRRLFGLLFDRFESGIALRGWHLQTLHN
jgi:hypothetical protein